jgi:ribonuclease M5
VIHLNEAVIVEGKYDKIKLSSLLDAVIIETGGFAIFSDSEKLALIRRMAQARGVIIMTDGDRAGFLIRSYLRGALPADRVRHVYIPDILGKEPRKAAPSKEGKLGVEGMPAQTLEALLRRAGVEVSDTVSARRRITKLDLYEDGFTGGKNSALRRRALLLSLGLPQRLSSNMLVEVLNAMMDYDAYRAAAAGIGAGENTNCPEK